MYLLFLLGGPIGVTLRGRLGVLVVSKLTKITGLRPGADIGGEWKSANRLNLNLSRIVSIFRTIQRSDVRA
jgi:hypothetical protein